jgi:DNA-directed RNA polymerase specialized sigma24 family protein
MDAETRARYEAALRTLDADERAALLGRMEHGGSYADLARLLGRPSAGAARMAVSRALARLARAMASR